MTFAAPIKVTVRLVVWDVNEETKAKSIKAVKEQEVYFGEIPLMTENGTFIVNGTERVIVSQLHRSPGVFFDQDQIKPHSGEKIFYYARIIPYRGSWIDFEFEQKDLLYVRIDRRRKIPVTVLLRALKYTGEELLDFFYHKEKVLIRRGKFQKEISKEVLVGQKATSDILDPETHKVILKKHRRITEDSFKRLELAKINTISVETQDLINQVGQALAKPARLICEMGKERRMAIGERKLTAEEIVDLSKEFTFFSWSVQGQTSPIPVAKAEGVYFWGAKGKRYLDFASQLVNANIGHQNPRVVKAIQEQAAHLTFVAPGMTTDVRALVGKKLAEITPGDLKKTFFTLGGAEANENAIKIARFYTGRHKILARYRSYHGATHGAMAGGSPPGPSRTRGWRPWRPP